jgi:hypothetical protein
MLRRSHALVSLFLAFGLISFIAPAVVFGDTTIASTDFGSSVSSTFPTDDVSPFSTDYTYPADTINFGRYSIDITANGYGPSEWIGYDHTNPGTGAFMIVDGSTNADDKILYYQFSAVAGDVYTFSGWFRPFQIDSDHNAILSFRVDNVEIDTYTETTALDWSAFSFSYKANAGGPITFSINDNNNVGSWNDFALDDITLTDAGSAPVPEPTSLLLLGTGLGGLALAALRRRK